MKIPTKAVLSRAVPQRRWIKRGSALLITLAFVVLLTVLIVSFLSRVLLEQRISTSSANQTKVDLFAEGAQASIIGYLQAEIESSANSTVVSTAGGNIYLPKATANMVPLYDYSGAPTTTAPNAVIANLLKVSNSSPVTGSTFPKATSGQTTTSSINNRSVSNTRWFGANGPQLVDSTAIGTYPALTPTWIAVARDGSNPTVFSSTVTYQPGNKTAASSVIGRYAFAMYDEGGLIDINTAGIPQTSTSQPTILTQASYSRGEVMADLTQLVPTTGSALTSAQIDTILGWRNNASLAVGTTAPTGTPSAPANLSLANATNFFSFIPTVANGFLGTANASVYTTTHATDQAFTSRLELIQFMTSLGNTGVLQYLTHFSRGLNQPSAYLDRASGSMPTGEPVVQSGTGSNTVPVGSDAAINPSFLTVRVAASSFTRNDGSVAVKGEPLVKKRFDLNRLAWLTYQGPMAGPDGVIGSFNPAAPGTPLATPNADVQKIAGYLQGSPYYVPASFLRQGTPSNIYKYFGLSYVQDARTVTTSAATPATYFTGDGQYKWVYDHSNTNATGPFTAGFGTATYPIPTAAKPIARVTDIAAYTGSTTATTPREPDFFELLKAADVCGSKAKPATLQAGVTPVTPQYQPDDFDAKADSSYEFAVIQMGVNIIDQAKIDGYPSRILFCDGATSPKEFRGVQNLPYIYRVRTAVMQEAPPIISSPGYPSTASPTTGTKNSPVAQPVVNYIHDPVTAPATAAPHLIGGTITKMGCNVVMDEPEIWNPHDQNSPRCAVDTSGNYLTDSSGKPLFPTSFRLVAESVDPDHIFVSTSLPSATGQTQATVPTSGNLVTTYGYTQVNVGNLGEFCDGADGIVFVVGGPGNFGQSGLTQAPATDQATLITEGYTPYTFPEGPFAQNSDFIFPSFPLTAESTALTFTIDETAGASGAAAFFREPTLLVTPNVPSGSNLATGGSANILNKAVSQASAIPGTGANIQNVLNAAGAVPTVYSTTTSASQPSTSPGPNVIGIYRNCMPGAYYVQATSTNGSSTQDPSPNGWGIIVPQFWDTPNSLKTQTNQYQATYRIQYESTPGSKNWRTYDEKYVRPPGAQSFPNYLAATSVANPNNFNFVFGGYDSPYIDDGYDVAYDPRTGRFCMPFIPPRENTGVGGGSPPHYREDGTLTSMSSAAPGGTWVNQSLNEVPSMMPDTALGWPAHTLTNFILSTYTATTGNQLAVAAGWYPAITVSNPPATNGNAFFNNDLLSNSSLSTCIGPYSLNLYSTAANAYYYQDPDGVVRRAAGGNSKPASYTPATVGLPMATASATTNQTQSRPIVLHRPFKSVAELGYVFSGTPWKNLDFFNSESGDAPLLDVFTVGDTTDTGGLVAGQINLNTQQVPVLQALISGAYKDEQNNYGATTGNFTPPSSNSVATLASLSGGSSSEANAIATALAARTLRFNASTSKGPLENVSDLVGKWVSGASNGNSQPYAGFADDLTATQYTVNSNSSLAIQRMREAATRGFAAAGQTRVWNLMIDVVAQTGRYPSTATTFDQFAVEGEQRYWVHLAIDRLTGQVIDKQVEVVKQ